jgi:hypothetical protein
MTATSTTTIYTEAERKAFEASLPNVARLGDWPHFLVLVDGKRTDDAGNEKPNRFIFEVQATADGARITPAHDFSPIAVAYAYDVEVLLKQARRGLRDSALFHHLGAGMRPTLASLIIESIIQAQTANAMLTTPAMR